MGKHSVNNNWTDLHYSVLDLHTSVKLGNLPHTVPRITAERAPFAKLRPFSSRKLPKISHFSSATLQQAIGVVVEGRHNENILRKGENVGSQYFPFPTLLSPSSPLSCAGHVLQRLDRQWIYETRPYKAENVK